MKSKITRKKNAHTSSVYEKLALSATKKESENLHLIGNGHHSSST